MLITPQGRSGRQVFPPDGGSGGVWRPAGLFREGFCRAWEVPPFAVWGGRGLLSYKELFY